jgi:hypothetical protein
MQKQAITPTKNIVIIVGKMIGIINIFLTKVHYILYYYRIFFNTFLENILKTCNIIMYFQKKS